VIAYSLAVASFFLFGVVVYRDNPAGDPGAFFELSSAATAGLQQWRQHNCVVCHQLYGFGGYLGPDLTHVASRVDEDQFLQILRAGTGPMPRIPITEDAARSLYRFLLEMDHSGQGHMPTDGQPPTWDEVFSSLNTPAPGIELFTRLECGRCHQPFRLGQLAAPDLTLAWGRMSALEIDGLLRRGRGNMPFYGLDNPRSQALRDLLRTLYDRRAELSRRPPSRRPALFWFNYDKPERP
jgi:nitric oxide reductase subunit C